MKVTVQVITAPTSDTPGTSLLLHFDSKRYLFGHVSEGAQRAYVQNHIRLGKVSDVFLSGKTEWRYTGGLVGLILTIGDQGSEKKGDLQALDAAHGGKKYSAALAEVNRQGITIHGGENLMHTLATTRYFVFRGAMRLQIDEISPEALSEKDAASRDSDERTPWFKDENVVVWPLLVYPEGYTPLLSTLDDDLPLPETTGRKRSFEDFKDSNRRDILKCVVEDMFCSNWTMDTMILDAIATSAPASTLLQGAPSTSPPEAETNEIRNLSVGPVRSTSPAKKVRSSPPALGAVTSVDITSEHGREPQLSTRAPPPGKQRAPWPASKVDALPRSKPSPMVLSYIVHLHPVRGKFLAKKAIELGIKPGKDFGKLTNGQNITTESGRVVTPEEVMEPPKPGSGIAVCDLPDTSYIDDFLNKEEWKDLERIRETVGCFFWLLGEGVVNDTRIQDFMNHMCHAKHVVSAKEVCGNPISFIGAAKSVTKLNMLDEKTFPLIYSTETPETLPTPYVPARPGLLWQIEPKWELQDVNLFEGFDAKKTIEEIEPEYLKKAEVAKESLKNFTLEEIPGKDVEIITLGTGSALPSKYRNVSGTIIRVPGVGNILFDCGENTLGQLGRSFGDQLPKVLKDLRAVYISHLHADHHLGFVAVLKAWYMEALKNGTKETDRKGLITVVAPRKFDTWLREYADVEVFGRDRIRFISCEELRYANSNNYKAALESLSLTSIAAAPAYHCQSSFTTAWTFNSTFKFAYSGDTRPTAAFVEIGKGATVLLHEATFDDELIEEAKIKKHSTTSEALRVGKEMGAWGVVLTHFSQRYPKLPVLDFERGSQRVVVAFDFMRVKVGDMGRFGGLIEGLKELYKADDEDEKENKKVAEGEEKVEVKVGKKEKEKKKKEKKEKKEKVAI
ncbi:hypothetical protein RUND412_008550 [Rhizina undulata]